MCISYRLKDKDIVKFSKEENENEQIWKFFFALSFFLRFRRLAFFFFYSVCGNTRPCRNARISRSVHILEIPTEHLETTQNDIYFSFDEEHRWNTGRTENTDSHASKPGFYCSLLKKKG